MKPLEWSYDGGGDFPHYWGQSDAFPSYGISRRYNRYILQHPFGFHLNSEHGTLEAAKAAAQADYERRILSALSQPHPADERVVEALRKIEKEANAANDVIRLNRDGSGQGRVKVATAMHRIAKWAEDALAKEGQKNV